jgi:tetracycline repressor-like protein
MRHTELALRALEPLGLDPATTIRTAVTLLAYIRGMAVGLQSERQAEQDTGYEWIESRGALFAPYIPQFPALGRLARQHGINMTLDALFERGLQLLLDGLAAHGAKAGRGTERRRSKRRAASR